jgi:hypothetical protein
MRCRFEIQVLKAARTSAAREPVSGGAATASLGNAGEESRLRNRGYSELICLEAGHAKALIRPMLVHWGHPTESRAQ